MKSPPYTILDAACACIASPDSFDPVVVGVGHNMVNLIDAMAGYANPSRDLLQEGKRIFGESREISMLISIGSGRAEELNLADAGKARSVFSRIAMDCEHTHESLYSLLRHTGAYFRFNVDRTIGIAMDPALIRTHVSAYIQKETVDQHLDDAIRRMQERPAGIVLKDIGVSFYLGSRIPSSDIL
jgi:hypothetical protein